VENSLSVKSRCIVLCVRILNALANTYCIANTRRNRFVECKETYAEEAIDWIPRVTLVGIDFQVTLCELEGVFRCDLVEGVLAAGLEFAGIAVTEDVALGVGGELDFPFDGAAMAVAFERLRHLDDRCR